MKKKSFLIIVFTFLLALISFTTTDTVAQQNQQERIIVTFKERINYELLNNEEIEIHHTFSNYNAVAITVTEEVKQQLRQHHTVKTIEPDSVISTNMQIVDWGFTEVNASESHKLGFTGKGIKIGIIDSGIDKNHPDLEVAGGISFIGSPTDYHDDDNGHGTHVAGIIAARDNDFGTIGIAPEVELYAIKAMGNDGLGNNSDVIQGIEWAVANNLDIINLSITTQQKSIIMELAINNAYEHGLLIVGAAGNQLIDFIEPVDVLYPARFPAVIAVGAINKNGDKSDFSYYGNSLEFVAPGEEVFSTYIQNPTKKPYATSSGTSMAAPFVTGIAALYKEAYPLLNNKQIRSLMQKDAMDLGALGKDSQFGYGLVQAPKSVVEIAFPDLEPNSWSEQAIMTLYKEGIISGYPDGNFYPSKQITRAEAITMISRTLHIEGTRRPTIFNDVSQEHYASGYIAQASERGIIRGYTNGDFGPSDLMIRADTAVMLVEGFNLTKIATSPFPDVKEAQYFTEAIHILKGMNIATGFPDGTYQPTKKITRAEFALLLAKAAEKNETSKIH
ncbi:S8 family serine peptidase [Sporosarcina siberiensis]|uniref:S8 family serine peptidase n=1 Tax=Sporosarcina siberiensis TaxID=1365606 RepID=A0ABW4SJ13_9BACL